MSAKDLCKNGGAFDTEFLTFGTKKGVAPASIDNLYLDSVNSATLECFMLSLEESA